MKKKSAIYGSEDLPPFRRDFFKSDEVAAQLGKGQIGGKAAGLAFIRKFLQDRFQRQDFPGVTLRIPRFIVFATDIFDQFMKHNDLYEIAFSDAGDDRIAYAFQRAEIPPVIVGDLRALIASVKTPLAVRSSSLLEDAMYEPFAGVYTTKMIPNNQFDVDSRFRRLVEAMKYVWASTFFKGARDYIKVTGKDPADEKMALVIQEVVGLRHGGLYYPHFSGVGRSYNYYPVGRAEPEEGVVDLALGLGKTIVDGGLSWSFSPAHPRVGPPAGSPGELLKLSQNKFWAVNMGKPPEHDPVRETEYLTECDLKAAEKDGTLNFVASTFRANDNRIVPGVGGDGPRVVNFAPLLAGDEVPLTKIITSLLNICDEAVGTEVEIEFAATLEGTYKPKVDFGFLQVRPMVVSHDTVEIADEEMSPENAVVISGRTMGNGTSEDIVDIIYVRPDVFEAKFTRKAAGELSRFNRNLVSEGRRSLLIGFGRWGSSDPWLGIPVEWGDISSAAVIVEATLPEMNVELSQGSHFFHNMTSFGIYYMSVSHNQSRGIDWEWLASQKEVAAGELVRHVRLDKPLTVKVDGRKRQGVVLK